MEFEDSYWLYYQRGLDARGDLTKSRKLGRNELKVLYFLFLMFLLFLLMMQLRQGVVEFWFSRATYFILGYVEFVATVGLVRLWGNRYYERLMLFFIPPVLVLVLWLVQQKTKSTRIARLLFILLLLSFWLIVRSDAKYRTGVLDVVKLSSLLGARMLKGLLYTFSAWLFVKLGVFAKTILVFKRQTLEIFSEYLLKRKFSVPFASYSSLGLGESLVCFYACQQGRRGGRLVLVSMV